MSVVTSAIVDNTGRTGSAGSVSTITSAPFGAAFAGRVIVVALETIGSGGVPTVTLGGIAAVVNGSLSSAGFIASAVVPLGTTGDIVCTFPSGSDQVFSEGIMALTGAASATPTSYAHNDAGSSLSIDVPAGGSIYSIATAPGAGTWTGVSPQMAHGGVVTGTFDNSGGAISGRTISYSTGVAIQALSFSPPAGGFVHSFGSVIG